MNIKLIKEKWIKFYKRGFLTGLMVLCFLCLIDQTLETPFFFNKIDSGNSVSYTHLTLPTICSV